MRITVIGAGSIGAAITRKLLRHEDVSQVQVCDRRARALQELHNRVEDPALRSFQVDARDVSVLESITRGSACVIACVPPQRNVKIAEVCLDQGIHYCNLGGNEDLVQHELGLHEEAEAKSVWIVPNCGLAPGLVNILCVHAIDQFDQVEAAHLRVGDVPINPEPPFNFRIAWSAEKLIEDYTNPVQGLEDGELIEYEPLNRLEEICFREPFDEMEAFCTQGGLSTLTKELSGKVKKLDHKTIRWPGHAQQMRFLLGLGFGERRKIDVRTHLTYRDVLVRRLRKKLGGSFADAVLMRVLVKGKVKGEKKTLIYKMIEYSDDPEKETAVEHCASLPVVTIATLLGKDMIEGGGARPPENILAKEEFLSKLRDGGLPIEKEWHDGHLSVTECTSTEKGAVV